MNCTFSGKNPGEIFFRYFHGFSYWRLRDYFIPEPINLISKGLSLASLLLT